MPKRSISDDNASHTEPHAGIDRAVVVEFAATLSPLALLLDIMRSKYVGGDLDGAIAVARAAAPYLHARLPAAVAVHPTTGDLGVMSDADLDAISSQD